MWLQNIQTMTHNIRLIIIVNKWGLCLWCYCPFKRSLPLDTAVTIRCSLPSRKLLQWMSVNGDRFVIKLPVIPWIVLAFLHCYLGSVGKPPQIYTGSWRDQVVRSRCHIGHLWLTHAFLLKGEPAPECIGGQSPLTIKHILLNCVDCIALHQQFILQTACMSSY